MTPNKLKHHVLELNDFMQWISGTEVMYANSSRERKKLICTLNGTFKVLVAGSVVHEGVQPFPALEAYNAITEKYIDDSLKSFLL